jgi:glycosyltransferase involved in cell wall biosynthesis
MINPHRVKGVDIFLEVARRLPDERFLLVESWPLSAEALAELRKKLAPLPNVEFWRRVPDAEAIYRRTRMLLIPSVWAEAFGRVAIEAQSCGIPVIASRRGGLPESVGDGGLCIDDYLNPAAWVRAIVDLTEDARRYAKLSERARAHAGQDAFNPLGAARRFVEICEDRSHFRKPFALAVRASLQKLLRRAS